MATKQPQIFRRGSGSGAKDITVVYTGLGNGDDGAWFSETGACLRSVSWSGTWGTGGSARVNASGGVGTDPRSGQPTGAQADESIVGVAASSNGTNTAGQYLAFPFVRPVVTAGDGTTSLTCTLYFVQD